MKKIQPIILVLNVSILTFCVSCGNGKDTLQEKSFKNVILMVSDGCGYNHIDAANIWEYGKKEGQIYEKFPIQFGMTTFSADGIGYAPQKAWSDFDYVRRKPTDSAASATALATGVKTYNGVIAVDQNKNTLNTIVQKFEELGRSTGVVTSVQFSHATPAAFGAHNTSRSNYEEIAREMMTKSRLDVIMGCGHPLYDNSGIPFDPSKYDFKYVGGKSTWDSLTAGKIGGDADGDGVSDKWTLIEHRERFQHYMNGQTPKRVMGVAKVRSTLQQSRKGDKKAEPFSVPFIKSVPTLKEMSQAALNILDEDQDGFFLLIEGGAVDWASHDNQSGRMIEEQIGFTKTLEAVIDWVDDNSSWDETLVIVTADHECGYLTGPDSGPANDTRNKPVWNPIVKNGKNKLPGMVWQSTHHTNSLVPFYAKGIGSDLFVQYADRTDPVRGKFIDNTDVGKVLFSLCEQKSQ